MPAHQVTRKRVDHTIPIHHRAIERARKLIDPGVIRDAIYRTRDDIAARKQRYAAMREEMEHNRADIATSSVKIRKNMTAKDVISWYFDNHATTKGLYILAAKRDRRIVVRERDAETLLQSTLSVNPKLEDFMQHAVQQQMGANGEEWTNITWNEEEARTIMNYVRDTVQNRYVSFHV